MILERSIYRRSIYFFVLSSLLLGASGCSKDKASNAATQVVAKVNGAEISVHQLNNALSKVPNLTQDTVEQARRGVLDRLVEQQLAVEQAMEQKLDRSPEVVMAIEAAKRDILTRAYFDKTLAALPKFTVEDAQKYYREHPELFAQRRVFNLQEIILPAQGAPVDKLKEMIGTKSMDDIALWLKQQKIVFSGSATTKSSDQLPLNMVPKLHAMKDGQTSVFETPQALSVVRVAASQPAPVDEATAIPRIQQFLTNQRAGTEIAENIKQLKEKAKIEIISANNEPSKPAGAELAAPAKSSPSNVEKGVAGLK